MAVATFAAGCFWGVEERFGGLPGVTATEVGYTGGSTTEPTYKEVCSNKTGHAEAVRLEYDPDQITYEQLLEAFFAMHDPTQWNRQGPDVGSQYRSAIFYHSPEQERVARDAVRRIEQSGQLRRPIVTQIVAAGPWWRAEDYHQKYFQQFPGRGCGV